MFNSEGQFVFFVSLILRVSSLNLDDPCINPEGASGRCINFRECEPLVLMRSKQVLWPYESSFLKNSLCGQSPTGGALVCCAGLPPLRSRDSTKVSKVPLLKPPHCGMDLSERIFGGQRTKLGEHPWAALIQYSKPNGTTGFHCGASLISSRYILTAAHCIQRIPNGWSVIGVRLGEWDLDSQIDQLDDEIADAPVDLGIEKTIVHENYQSTNKAQYNDIALIRLNRNVSSTYYIKPICLPVDVQYRNLNIKGTQGVAVGWGRTETSSTSSVKMKVGLEFKDLQGCSKAYLPYEIDLKDTQLCAGGKRAEDTCSGDSGGPLAKLIKANYFQYGITSFGSFKCGTAGVPGVYTNVAKYIDWIESQME